MAKLHRTYRLEADIVADLEAFADENGITKAEAIENLLRAALDSSSTAQDERTPSEPREDHSADTALVDVLRGNVTDLRAQVATLTNQIAAKDEQISQLMEQAGALMKITGNAQALQGAAEQRAFMAGTTTPAETTEAVKTAEERPQDVTADEEDQEAMTDETGPQTASQGRSGGILAAIARWFGGE